MKMRAIIALTLMAFIFANSTFHAVAQTTAGKTSVIILESQPSQLENLINQIRDEYEQLTQNLNNLNPLSSKNDTSPSVKIINVSVNSPVALATPARVTLTLLSGNVRVDNVRTDVIFKDKNGNKLFTGTNVTSFNAAETKVVTFGDRTFPSGIYTIDVLVYKNGTDPSNPSTPRYDFRENAATMTVMTSVTSTNPTPNISITSANTSAISKSDEGRGSVSAILNSFDTLPIMLIAIIAVLILVSLYFILWDNKTEDSGVDSLYRIDLEDGAAPIEHANNSVLQKNPRNTLESDADSSSKRLHGDTKPIRIDEDDKRAAERPEDVDQPTFQETQLAPERQFEAEKFTVGDITSKKEFKAKTRRRQRDL